MTSSDTTFSAGLPHAVHPALAPALAARGYEKLTAVQLAVLGEELADADLLVSAQTGSGKTVAFGLAIASSLLAGGDRFGRAERPLGLIIAPTRELALQVQRELDWLYAESGVVTASCVGGMDARTERRALERGAHIVVGTPGRLRDHITRGALDLSDIQAVVLDEADEMLDLGFREDLEFILAAAPEDRRTLLFSATVPRAIAELAKTFQRDAVRITATAATERHADIEYQMVLTQSGERESAIINTLLFFDSSSSIVFCHTREAVKQLTTRLAGRGFPVVALSGELTQSERTHALEAMRDGRARVCVATDVAARGIDLPNLDLVVHAELPTKPDTLLHRSGRTGRAGRKGVCVLIVPQHRRSAALRVFKLANIEAITRSAPSMAEIEARNRQQILEVAAASPGPDADEAPMVAELLARVSPEQLAAAYLRQQVSARPAPETISAVAISAVSEKPRRHEKGSWEPVGEGSERPPRAPDMVGGVWFTLSLGRKHRADPKWLLPMICKAGGVTKREVGSIKILDTETRFEIAADRAEAFAGLVARNGSGEKGVNIAPADGRAAPQPRVPPVRRDEPPREHARPGAVEKSAAEPATPPRPRKQ
ncbi:MAG TPA: DEAD/DEAH box helicase, partial [Devosiaceae bacterium]|nr:DEAD/DEAH box helicase [Devosiaceae bacterium]